MRPRRLFTQVRRPFAGPLLVGGFLLLLTTGCQTTSRPAPETPMPPAFSGLVAPLAGPGQPPIDTSGRKAVSAGWNALRAGDREGALASVSRRSDPQADLLRLQVDGLNDPTEAAQQRLEHFLSDHPRYASAWATLAHVAEQRHDETTALRAARRFAQLWPTAPLAGRADDLYRRWVVRRIESGRDLVRNGQPDEAIRTVRPALELDPENRDARLVLGEASMELGQLDEADATLAELGSNPEALVMRAELASRRQLWNQAMDLLHALPPDDPRREPLLRKARLMWRISILPAHVREALKSEALTRGQLATLLLAMVPSLEIQPGGSTPLMADVIDLPSQRAILTAARLDIMSIDRVAGLFHPDQPVTGRESRDAVNAVCHLAGLRAPVWCELPTEPSDGCLTINEPVTGMDLVEILLDAEVRSP